MARELKAVRLEEEEAGRIAKVVITGKLAKDDYEFFVPEIERLIELHGKIRLLVELVDFHGWSVAAAWEDTKFGVRHFNDIDRLAVVGDSQWERGMAVFCKPFTRAEVRYFDLAAADEAERWIREGL